MEDQEYSRDYVIYLIRVLLAEEFGTPFMTYEEFCESHIAGM